MKNAPRSALAHESQNTPEELRKMLDEMRVASSRFYGMATASHCHPFIEFTGFMNEYINICRKALAKGVDFSETNVHSSGTLPMETYEAAYIGEKFGCIFGNTFGDDPKLLNAFLWAAFKKEIKDAPGERIETAPPASGARGGESSTPAGASEPASSVDRRALRSRTRGVKGNRKSAKRVA